MQPSSGKANSAVVMPTRQKFETLDLLRATASVAVVFWHIAPLRGTVMSFGGLAVDLFFMISGFVIAHAYEGKIASGMTFARFVELRLVRLYPLYALGSLLGFAAVILGFVLAGFHPWQVRRLFPEIGTALLLLPKPNGLLVPAFLFNPPAWSLFFELMTNFGHILALRWLTEKALIGVVIAAAAGVVIVQVATGVLAFGDVGWVMFFGVPRVLVAYFAGVLIFRLWREGRLPRIRLAPAALPLIFLLFVEVPESIAPLSVTGDVAVFLAFPLLIVAAVQNEPPSGLLGVARVGERLSYPLYMVHVPWIMAAEVGLQHHLCSPATGYAGAVVLAFASAALLERKFDKPVRVNLNKLLGQRRLARRAKIEVSSGPG